MFTKFLKNKIYAGAIVGLLITLIVSLLNIFGALDSLHRNFANSLYTYNNPSQDIIIIAIDDKSTQPSPEGFGRFSNWSRNNYVKLLDVLKNENPKVITFDLIFSTYTEMLPIQEILNFDFSLKSLSSNKEKFDKYQEFINSYKYSINNPIDDKFSEKLKEFDNIILSAVFSGNSLIKPLDKFGENSTISVVNAPIEKEGIIRYAIPYFTDAKGEKYDDMAVSSVKKYLNKSDLNFPLENDQLLVNFFGDPYSYQMIPFVDVVNKNFAPQFFQNKIVLIGVTSTKEIHDEHYTPRDNQTPMPGVEFRANEIQTILDGKFLTNQSAFSQVLTVAAISVALTIAINYLSILFATILSLVAILLYILAAHFFYRQGIIVNMIYPFLAIILAYLGSWVYKYFIADKSKREIKFAFSHYVSGELVEQIAQNPEMAKLGGEKRVATILFCDIKDSTKISEKTEITSWVSQLNEYFTVMENVIKHYGGTIDKYEGDAIMAFWNAPVMQPDHVKKAYLAALEMKNILQKLNQKWQKENRPTLEFRIGINTGEVIVGNIGSKDRFNYTVMGDSVNISSRLESTANKVYGTNICVAGFEKYLGTSGNPDGSASIGSSDSSGSSANFSSASLSEFILREIDTVKLPGKDEAIVLYEILGQNSERSTSSNETANLADQTEATSVSNTPAKLAENYKNALNAYRRHDYESAISILKKILEDANQAADGPSKILLARCEILKTGGQIIELDKEMVFRIANK